jgi:hypothetical protein
MHMQRLVSSKFVEPEHAAEWSEEPLVIHQRFESTSNNKLIIFVHGLGGRRYGEKSTWGNFPRMIFEDISEIDVGMYQYRTGAGRFLLSRSV